QESNSITDDFIEYLSKNDSQLKSQLEYLRKTFIDAKNYGSLLNLKNQNFHDILNHLLEKRNSKTLTDEKYNQEINNILSSLIKQSTILSEKFDIVLTNPPYMGGGGMNPELTNFLKKNFPDSKKDLFAVFIEQCQNFTSQKGFTAMITQQSFMFLSSFEKLREKFLENNIINMIHLGARAFEEIGGEVVQASSFVIQKTKISNYKSTFVKLTDENSEKAKEKKFLTHEKEFIAKTTDFSKIPGSPIAYWVEPELINAFKNGKSLDILSNFTGSQNKTADNNKYLRMHWEIDNRKIGSKWALYAKGGEYRKFYGNIEIVVDWSEEARSFYKNNKTSNLLNEHYWYKKGITFTKISSKGASFRYMPENCIFDMGGPSLIEVENLWYCLGFLCSKIAENYLKMMNPTLNTQIKEVKVLPIIISAEIKEEVEILTKRNVEISKEDWDNYETSVDFLVHPFLRFKSSSLFESFNLWKKYNIENFNEFKQNEDKINKLFIETYGVKSLSPEIEDNEVTLKTAESISDVKNFISYFVGCLFGRYSLDKERFIFSGGKINLNDYCSFIPDDDNIIPVLDSDYFEDDIVTRFIEFLKVTFGEEYLEENISFIASHLGKKGNSNREIIRNYFLNDFFKNHVKMYKKTPIYWLFSSGKNNGFKALIYMHRYSSELVARVRTDYLHKTQKSIEIAIENCDNIINNSSNNKEVSTASKEKNKLLKQLEETRAYDKALGHIANKQIAIDLDDGVKINYEKFQNVEITTSNEKIKKVNILEQI
ncbi:MAG: BREX-1 system adenine-specific DNA-methyltransferase PglX, partial [Methanobrevibacter sp.]|nr:BREX-1 system adenine-specific DNA-methyltransferase PglX [Methanobrevibacter sp.]